MSSKRVTGTARIEMNRSNRWTRRSGPRKPAWQELSPEEAWQPFQPDGQNPWDERRAMHLMRRAAFGCSRHDLRPIVDQGLDATVDWLLDESSAVEFDRQMEQTARILATGNDGNGLAAWWLLKMVQTPAPAIEKLTLFWHGHFATSHAKVQRNKAMLDQYRLLHQHAAGNFADLVHGISRDIAMLVYLDSTDNRKTRPNENYARELLELFCLGIGNYTENDIKQLARCFTGWEVRRGRFRFNRFQHDGGTKTLFGQTGNFDGDQAIDIVLQQPAAARFIARKLIRFYVWDERELTDEWVEPIATTLRENQFEIRPALRQIFTSRIFHAADTRGAKIKSPVELGVGVLRQLRAAINMNELANRMQELGQLPFHPPSVKGWDGGRTWINAATILSRANLVEHIVRSGQTKFADGDLAAWYQESQYNDVADLASHWLAVELAPEIIRELARTIPAGQTVTPNQVASAMTQLAVLPEFQLN